MKSVKLAIYFFIPKLRYIKILPFTEGIFTEGFVFTCKNVQIIH